MPIVKQGLAFVVALVFCGCTDERGPLLTSSTAHLSQFGYTRVTFTGDVASLGEVWSVRLGGVPAYDPVTDATSLTVTVQGAPRPGPATLEVFTPTGGSTHHGVVTYDPPTTGAPPVWAAFGASLTQGTQSMGVDEHTQTKGFVAMIARQVGVFLPFSVFADGIAEPLHATDFDLDCNQKPNTGINATKLLNAITDPASGFFDLRRARKAWDTTPQNFAIGGSKVAQTLRGGSGTVAILEHIVEEPTIDPGDVVGMVDISQIQRLEALNPDVVLASDLLANDLDPAVTESDDVHPEKITPLSDVQPLLVEMMQRLGALHGHYFIANMASLTFIPNVVEVKARRLAAGTDTEASFDAKLAQIDQLTQQYNDALAQAMAPYPNLHLVDFFARVQQVRSTGIRAGGELCTVDKFGGLLSFDNLHFSDTGYANYANLFIDQLNGVLGLSIPSADVDLVHTTDEAAPSVLRAQGFTCVPPPG
jgi:hypothetical protein